MKLLKLRFIKKFIALGIYIVLIGQSWAQFDCPISNPKYKNLQDSALNLLKILQSKNFVCEDEKKRIKEENDKFVEAFIKLNTYQSLYEKINNNNSDKNINLTQFNDFLERLQNIADPANDRSLLDIYIDWVNSEQVRRNERQLKEQQELEETRQKIAETTLIINSLSSLLENNAILWGDCFQEEKERTNFFVALMDTVSYFTPYLPIIAPETAPYALGATILTPVIKAFFELFYRNKAKMTPELALAFRTHACSYYNINENVQALYNSLENEESQIKIEYNNAQVDFKKWLDENKMDPPKPEMTYIDQLEQSLAIDEETLGLFTDTSNPLVNLQFISLLLNQPDDQMDLPKNAIGVIEKLIEDDNFSIDRLSLFKLLKTKMKLLNSSNGSIGGDTEKDKETFSATWVTTVKEIVTIAREELNKTKDKLFKVFEQSEPMLKYQAFLKVKAEKESALAKSKARVDFLDSLIANGAVQERTTLIQIIDPIKKAMFGERAKKENSAMVWLEYYMGLTGQHINRSTELLKVSQFENRDINNDDHVKEVSSRPLACESIDNIAFRLRDAQEHVNATQAFCYSFRKTIAAEFKDVSEYCFGREVGDIQQVIAEVEEETNLERTPRTHNRWWQKLRGKKKESQQPTIIETSEIYETNDPFEKMKYLSLTTKGETQKAEDIKRPTNFSNPFNTKDKIDQVNRYDLYVKTEGKRILSIITPWREKLVKLGICKPRKDNYSFAKEQAFQ